MKKRMNKHLHGVVGFVIGTLLTVAIVLLLEDSSNQLEDAPDTIRQHIESAVQALGRGFATGNIEALSDVMHPDVVVFESGLETYNWTEFRDIHIQPELERLRPLAFGFEGIDINVQDKTAWVHADYFSEVLSVSTQEQISFNGVATMVWVFDNEVWKLIQLHMTAL